jgi:hypothetical protein
MSSTFSKTDAVKALNEILKVSLDQCDISVCVASLGKDDSLPQFQKLQLADDLTTEFRNISKKCFERLIKDVKSGNSVLQPYDPGASLESHEAEYFNMFADSTVAQQIDSLKALASLSVFAVEPNFVQGLRFYVIIAQPKQGEPIYFFRTYTPKKELGRSAFLGAILEKGHFDTVKQPLFLFDYNVDCLSRGDDMFIFSKDKFQKIFQFFEKLLESAAVTLKEIESQVPILNFDKFEDSCKGHLQKLAKLSSIASKPYFKLLSMTQMKKVIKDFKLPLQTKKVNGKEMLVFDESDKWVILHLLDDYYLGSPMTGIKYGVPSKREL